MGSEAWCRGWEGEVGCEEEVGFLAAVAKEETVGVKAQVGEFLEELERGMVGTGTIEEGRAGRWLREVLGVVEPYVRIWEGVWPATEVEKGEVLQRILVET